MANGRKMPTGKAGSTSAPVDPAGMDPEMQQTLGLVKTKKMDATETGYVKSRKGAPSAMEAVRRARKANKQPPIPEE